jgi:hypothetical protein
MRNTWRCGSFLAMAFVVFNMILQVCDVGLQLNLGTRSRTLNSLSFRPCLHRLGLPLFFMPTVSL